MPKKSIVIDCQKLMACACDKGLDGQLAASLGVSRTTAWKLMGGRSGYQEYYTTSVELAERIAELLELRCIEEITYPYFACLPRNASDAPTANAFNSASRIMFAIYDIELYCAERLIASTEAKMARTPGASAVFVDGERFKASLVATENTSPAFACGTFRAQLEGSLIVGVIWGHLSLSNQRTFMLEGLDLTDCAQGEKPPNRLELYACLKQLPGKKLSGEDPRRMVG